MLTSSTYRSIASRCLYLVRAKARRTGRFNCPFDQSELADEATQQAALTLSRVAEVGGLDHYHLTDCGETLEGAIWTACRYAVRNVTAIRGGSWISGASVLGLKRLRLSSDRMPRQVTSTAVEEAVYVGFLTVLSDRLRSAAKAGEEVPSVRSHGAACRVSLTTMAVWRRLSRQPELVERLSREDCLSLSAELGIGTTAVRLQAAIIRHYAVELAAELTA